MTCLNCGNEFEGAYCPVCGQSAKVRKLTMAALFEGLMGALFSFDRGIWRTIGHLFSKPGTMISEYINGRRVSYVNPFSLLVILTTIFVVEAHLLGNSGREHAGLSLGPTTIEFTENDSAPDSLDTGSKGRHTIDENVILTRLEKIKSYARKSRLLNEIYDWSKGNKLFYTIITIPLITLSVRLSFRKKRKRKEGVPERVFLNYAECLCAVAYFTCQLLCISIITMPFNPGAAKLDGFTDVAGLVMVIFLAWDIIGLYRLGKRKAFFKAVGIMILYYIFIVILAILIVTSIWIVSGLLR